MRLNVSISSGLDRRAINHFDRNALRIAGKESNAFKSRTTLVPMKVGDFLKLTPDVDFNQSSKLEYVTDLLEKGVKFNDIPFLKVKVKSQKDDLIIFKVYGHEGRHRAHVLKNKFNKDIKMPVKLIGMETRWEEEDFLGTSIALNAQDNDYEFVIQTIPKRVNIK